MARERGQATVELLGTIPALIAAGLVVWQLILVGHTAWMSAHAARAAARADLVGDDAEAAARSALPLGLERGLDVEAGGGGSARVAVRVPPVHPDWQGRLEVAARAALDPIR
ncbi:MAG: pilus assembly protein [Thermoleophilaceae bacterium]